MPFPIPPRPTFPRTLWLFRVDSPKSPGLPTRTRLVGHAHIGSDVHRTWSTWFALVKWTRGELLFLWIALFASPGTVVADDSWLHEGWSITLFSGPLSTDPTTNEILVGSIGFEDSAIVGAGLAKDVIRTGTNLDFQVEFQTVKHLGRQDHWEFNGLVIARWSKFPWDHLIDTTVAIGNGLSYPTEVPRLERERHGPDESTRLLNYTLVEITFALPNVLDWSLVWRYHHRSGAFGTFDGVTEGSTVLAGGIKYRF